MTAGVAVVVGVLWIVVRAFAVASSAAVADDGRYLVCGDDVEELLAALALDVAAGRVTGRVASRLFAARCGVSGRVARRHVDEAVASRAAG